MIFGVSNILDPKCHARKFDKIHINCELYQVFMHNILCQNVQIFSLYTLFTRKMYTLRFKGIEKFRSGSFKIFFYKIDKIHIFYRLFYCFLTINKL